MFVVSVVAAAPGVMNFDPITSTALCDCSVVLDVVAAVYSYPLFHIEKPQLQCQAGRVAGGKGRAVIKKLRDTTSVYPVGPYVVIVL